MLPTDEAKTFTYFGKSTYVHERGNPVGPAPPPRPPRAGSSVPSALRRLAQSPGGAAQQASCPQACSRSTENGGPPLDLARARPCHPRCMPDPGRARTDGVRHRHARADEPDGLRAVRARSLRLGRKRRNAVCRLPKWALYRIRCRLDVMFRVRSAVSSNDATGHRSEAECAHVPAVVGYTSFEEPAVADGRDIFYRDANGKQGRSCRDAANYLTAVSGSR